MAPSPVGFFPFVFDPDNLAQETFRFFVNILSWATLFFLRILPLSSRM